MIHNLRKVFYGKNIYRTAIPTVADKEGFKYLKNLGIKKVIDLRSMAEVEAKPFAYSGFFKYKNLPLPDFERDSETMEEYYLRLFSQKETLREILKEIEGEDVLYGCFLGKDRTGIVSAILHAKIRLPKEDILADYAKSTKGLRNMDINPLWKVANPDILEDSFDVVRKSFGGVRRYLAVLEQKKSQR